MIPFGLSMDYHVFILSRVREKVLDEWNWYLPKWLEWLPEGGRRKLGGAEPALEPAESTSA